MLVVAALAGAACAAPGDDAPPSLRRHDLFVMFSARAPLDAPDVFRARFTTRDLARVDTLPRGFGVPRARRYALPTSLRERWAGWPGVRHWVRRGCGRGTPGLIVYDPERRELTPPSEQRRLIASIRRAERMVRATGCHSFGLAPGSTPLFGLDPARCDFDLGRGSYRRVAWRRVDLVDVQAQRLAGDDCAARDGLARYDELVTSVARYVRARNPRIRVVTQVSFRDSPPARMVEAVARVAPVVDGVYFSYPTTNDAIPCRYCTPANMDAFLGALRR